MPVTAPPARPRTFGAVEAAPSVPRIGAAVWLLTGWWVLLSVAGALWLAADRRPPSWDPAIHLISSLRYRGAVLDLWNGKAAPGETLGRLLGVDAFYPPFAPFVGAVATLAAPPDARLSTWVVNQLFLALLLAGTFRLGRRLAGEGAGVAAAVAVTTFPAILASSHRFMLDVPLAAVAVLALDTLLASEDCAKTGASAAFGVLCGIGMLTKWTFAFFLAAPVVVAAFRAAVERGNRPRRVANLAMALALAGLVAAPWYLVHAANLARDVAGFGGFSRDEWRGFAPVGSASSLGFYPRALARLLAPPWLLLLLAGLAASWRRRALWRLALLSLPAVVLLTLLPAKDDRYLFPLLPVAAVLATAWAGEAGARRSWRRGVLAVAAAVSLFLAARRDPPSRERWPIEEAVASLPAAASGIAPCVRVIPDTPEFHRWAFDYAARESGRRVEIAGASQFPWFTDAVVVKTGDPGAHPGSARTMAAIQRGDGGFCDVFRKTWQSPLPDGSRGEIWVRDVRPLSDLSPAEVVERLKSAVVRDVERRLRARFGGNVDIQTISDEKTLRGQVRRISVFARDLEVGGAGGGTAALRIRELACELEDVGINPYRLRDTGELELLSLGAVTPRLSLAEEDVNAYLAAHGDGTPSRVSFRGGRIELTMTGRRLPPVRLVVKPRLVAGSNVALAFESFRLAGVPLPASLAAVLASPYNPIFKEMPCRVHLSAVLCDRGELRVEGGAPPRAD